MKTLGTVLEVVFFILLAFHVFMLCDWVLYPEKDRPWRAGAK